MSTPFDRMINVTIRDGNDDLLRGSDIEWLVNGVLAGRNVSADGHASLALKDPSAVVSLRVSYPGQTTLSATLALNQTFWEFKFPKVIQNPKWKEFLMKHFPAAVGIVFVLLALVVAFIFKQPTSLQTHIVLALFALGGGGFGGEIAGFINADIKLGQQLTISAGGAAAIFALLYFFVPAGS